MSMLRICAAEGCNVKTMGRLCLEHEAAGDEVSTVLLERVDAAEDDERESVVSGAA
jgi:hypothetical protein